MKKIAVLASGKGTNLQAILDAIDRGDIKEATVSLVLSDRKDAYALERASMKGILAVYIGARKGVPREEYDRQVVTYLKEQGIDLVVLAGFMRVLTPYFVEAFRHRILNIHPALLPSFPGAHGVEDALSYGVKVTGCTIHFVDEGMDTGPIILQEPVLVSDGDTVETLHQRIQVAEHRLYPKAINLFVQGKIRIEGRRCFIDEG